MSRIQLSDSTLKAVGITVATVATLYALYSFVVPKNPFAHLPNSKYDPFVSYIYDPSECDKDVYQEYAPCERITVGTTPTLLVNDPNLAHQVLVRQDRYKQGHPYGRNSMTKLFHNLLIGGDSVANATGDDWRVRRDVLVPLFQGRVVVPQLLPYVIKRTEEMIEEIKAYKGKPCDIEQLFVRLTADVICEYIFGERPDRNEVKFNNMINPLRTVATMKLRRFLILLGKKDAGTAEIEQNSRFVRRMIHKVKRGELKRSDGSPTLVEQLLEIEQYQGPEGEDRLEQELLIMIFAGHDTTAHSMTMLSYVLAKEPHCQEKIREEVERVIPDVESMTASNLGKLKYTSAAIKEGLRMHPVVASITLTAYNDSVLGGIEVPKGNNLMLPVIRIQRDDSIYKKPLAYMPERWLEENLELAHDLEKVGDDKTNVSKAFVAFSQGTHSCLGMNLAYLELRVVTAMLVKHFEFKYDGPVPKVNGVLLRLKKNPEIEFHERQTN